MTKCWMDIIYSICKQNIKCNKNGILFVFDRDENIVEKGENAGFQPFPFSHYVFKKCLLSQPLKLSIVW